MRQAGDDLEQYVEAAQRAHHEQLARKQILLMSEATSAQDFRARAADLLQRLGDEAAAGRLRERPLPAEDGAASGETGLLDEASERWSTILRLALMSPSQIDRL